MLSDIRGIGRDEGLIAVLDVGSLRERGRQWKCDAGSVRGWGELGDGELDGGGDSGGGIGRDVIVGSD